MKSVDKERADRVIKIFNDSKLNQRQFAELIGVSQQLVSAVVNYTKKPNETILLAILDNIEGIDPMWLFTGIEGYTSAKSEISPIVKEIDSPIEDYIKKTIEEQLQSLSDKLLQRISNLEDSLKQ